MNLKNHPLFCLAVALGIPFTAFAGAHYGPQPCSAKELKLDVSNSNSESIDFWVQVHDGNTINETAYSVAGHQQLQLLGPRFLREGSAFAIRDHSSDLKYTLSCHGVSNLTEDASPRVEYKVTSGPLILHLQNLHHSGQNIDLRYLDFWGRTLRAEKIILIKNYVSMERKLNPPRRTKTVLVEGEARMNSQLFQEANMQPLTARSVPARVQASSAKSYFLAANDSMTESYIVPIDDPDLAAEARAIVKDDLAKIIIADVEPSPAGGENRDLASRDSAPWSWRVKKVYSFSDVGHQACSGSPGFTEDFKEEWMPGDHEICYWTFSLKREVTAEEVSSGRLAQP